MEEEEAESPRPLVQDIVDSCRNKARGVWSWVTSSYQSARDAVKQKLGSCGDDGLQEKLRSHPALQRYANGFQLSEQPSPVAGMKQYFAGVLHRVDADKGAVEQLLGVASFAVSDFGSDDISPLSGRSWELSCVIGTPKADLKADSNNVNDERVMDSQSEDEPLLPHGLSSDASSGGPAVASRAAECIDRAKPEDKQDIVEQLRTTLLALRAELGTSQQTVTRLLDELCRQRQRAESLQEKLDRVIDAVERGTWALTPVGQQPTAHVDDDTAQADNEQRCMREDYEKRQAPPAPPVPPGPLGARSPSHQAAGQSRTHMEPSGGIDCDFKQSAAVSTESVTQSGQAMAAAMQAAVNNLLQQYNPDAFPAAPRGPTPDNDDDVDDDEWL